MNPTSQEILTAFKPQRIKRSASFVIHEKIKNVFPLFGPIREKDWAEGWEPEMLYRSGNVLAEEHMIFQTNSPTHDEKFTWVISKFQPDLYLVEYTVSAHDRLWFISVQCSDQTETTNVTVSYTYTGFTREGHQRNEDALKHMYAHDLNDWAEAIHYFIETGTRLSNP